MTYFCNEICCFLKHHNKSFRINECITAFSRTSKIHRDFPCCGKSIRIRVARSAMTSGEPKHETGNVERNIVNVTSRTRKGGSLQKQSDNDDIRRMHQRPWERRRARRGDKFSREAWKERLRLSKRRPAPDPQKSKTLESVFARERETER